MPFFGNPPTDIRALWLIQRGLVQGCAFLGFIDMAPHLGVKSSSQTREIEKHAYYLGLRASGNLPVSYVLTGNLPPINYR